MDLAYKTFMFCCIATMLMIVVGCAASDKVQQTPGRDAQSNQGSFVTSGNTINVYAASFLKEIQDSIKGCIIRVGTTIAVILLILSVESHLFKIWWAKKRK